MSVRRALGAALAVTALVAGLLAGCGGSADDGPEAGATAGASADGSGATGGTPGVGAGASAGTTGADQGGAVVAGASRFVVLKAGGWFLSQGIKPIGNSVKQYLETDRSFDWYAEYAEPDADQSLRITGHLRGLTAQTAVLKKLGGKITQAQIGGRKAVWSAPPGAAPVTVLIEFGPNYTIEFATSGVDVQDTLKLAAALKPVDEAAWKKAGGLVIDCPPGGDACPN